MPSVCFRAGGATRTTRTRVFRQLPVRGGDVTNTGVRVLPVRSRDPNHTNPGYRCGSRLIAVPEAHERLVASLTGMLIGTALAPGGRKNG
jgi:hypothetical protein